VTRVLLVGLGGAVGSILRYLIGLAVVSAWPSPLPLGTLIVNVAGCAAIGVASAMAQRSPPLISAEGWALLVTGLLGGFTTFSAFGLETAGSIDVDKRLACANVALHLVLGIGAVFAGRALARGVFGAPT
jgi:CrcB protein